MKTAIKSLKIIKEMYEYFVKNYRTLEPKLMICEKEDFGIIENALKEYEGAKAHVEALALIKKCVDFKVYEMQGNYYLTTGNNYRGQISITKEEYDLLKEVLL